MKRGFSMFGFKFISAKKHYSLTSKINHLKNKSLNLEDKNEELEQEVSKLQKELEETKKYYQGFGYNKRKDAIDIDWED